MNSRSNTRIVALIAILVAALGFYFVLLGRIGIGLLCGHNMTGRGLGLGVIILPLIGLWVVAATLRAGLSHQRLAHRIHAEGRELDIMGLPRRPSGRIDRDAADALFARVKTEWEAEPDNWRNSYRLARAYDYAGDRSRAREAMQRAVALERWERRRES